MGQQGGYGQQQHQGGRGGYGGQGGYGGMPNQAQPPYGGGYNQQGPKVSRAGGRGLGRGVEVRVGFFVGVLGGGREGGRAGGGEGGEGRAGRSSAGIRGMMWRSRSRTNHGRARGRAGGKRGVGLGEAPGGCTHGARRGGGGHLPTPAEGCPQHRGSSTGALPTLLPAPLTAPHSFECAGLRRRRRWGLRREAGWRLRRAGPVWPARQPVWLQGPHVSVVESS
jgi:hypothetical protein